MIKLHAKLLYLPIKCAKLQFKILTIKFYWNFDPKFIP